MDRLEKMKLGRRKAYLKKCIKVVELLSEHETENTVRRRIFDQYIRPIVCCSYPQFNNMLNEPNPYKQLEDLNLKIASGNKGKGSKDLGGSDIYVHPAPIQTDNSSEWDYDIDLVIE